MENEYRRLSDGLYVALGNGRRAVGVRFLPDEDSFGESDAPSAKGKMPYCGMVRLASMGRSLKATSENQACKGGARALGFSAPDDDYLSGNRYEHLGIYQNIDVCRRMARNIVCCPHRAHGIELRPLESCFRDPDVVILVLNAYQAMRVIQGYEYVTGDDLSFKAFGNQAVCSECTARPYVSGGVNLSLLCSGTRYNARWGDDELMLGLSADKFGVVVDGVLRTINAMESDGKKEEIAERQREKGVEMELRYRCGYFMKGAEANAKGARRL